MSFEPGWKTTTVKWALVILISSAAVALGGFLSKANSSKTLLLEVINRHFTVGRHIPSVYLRVYSDGTTECHTEKFWDEPDVAKHKTLDPVELQQLQAVLDDPELPHVKREYGLMHIVIDSWMEWDIRVPHGWRAEKFTVLNFSPAWARKRNQAYPSPVLKLGCSIWKLRYEVYGDAQYQGEPFYRADDCKKALEIQ